MNSYNMRNTPSKSPNKDTDRAPSRVQIMVRLRPAIEDEDPEAYLTVEDQTLRINRPANPLYMKFSRILPEATTQAQQFFMVQDFIDHFLNGTNCTIFAYGQTGAGKTFSMIGQCKQPTGDSQDFIADIEGQQRGILPRSLELIIKQVNKRKQKNSKLMLSFFQVYNQKIYDLFSCSDYPQPLEIRENKTGEVTIPDLQFFEVSHFNQAIQLLHTGLRNRVTGSTAGNKQSSRSHSIFQLVYQRTQRTKTELGSFQQQYVQSSLRIVDLAGSQKFKIPVNISNQEKEIRIQELTCINGSLSALGQCISALIQKSRTHIPFRNSKLTRVLSDALTGNGKLRFVVCVSPSVSSAAETFSTLQFANRAKRAVLQVRQPKLQKKKTESEQVQNLRKQLEQQRRLRMQLERQLKSKQDHKVYIENRQLREQIQRLKAQLQSLSKGGTTALKHTRSQDYNLENLSIFKDITHSKNKLEPKEASPSAKKRQYYEHRISTFLDGSTPRKSIDHQKENIKLEAANPDRKFEVVRKPAPKKVQAVKDFSQKGGLQAFESFDFNRYQGRSSMNSMQEQIRRAVMGLKDMKEKDKQIQKLSLWRKD